MDHISSTAMVLAAGKGIRMRPLTLETPKPLLEVGGRTMLDLALDRLVEVGIRRVVVNACYLGDMIEAHVARRGREWERALGNLEIVVSREAELLDTGGGIKNVVEQFGGKPFFALNADLPWRDDGYEPALARMARAWDAEAMDALLLVMPTHKARGFSADGDFAMDATGAGGAMAPFPGPPHGGEGISPGLLRRLDVAPPRPYVMLSAQIVKPELFAEVQDRVFSNKVVWSMAERRRRLYGLIHQGSCYHVGRPEDLRCANALLESGEGWGVA